MVQQAGDGDAVRQVVDEGDVVDQVVSFSDAEDHDGGSALKHRSMLLKGHFTSFRLFTAQGEVYKLEGFTFRKHGTGSHVAKTPPKYPLRCHLIRLKIALNFKITCMLN